jgi:UDP-N-acetylglucosamine 2-epimerase (non-hydrolysing)
VKILCVAGTRGERAKLSPVIASLRAADHELTSAEATRRGAVPTWDREGMPPPELGLEIKEATPALRVAAVLRWLEPMLDTDRPDLLLNCGASDTAVGSLLVASLAGVPTAHLDAGMRPDPGARAQVLDQAAAFLIVPHPDAIQHLAQRAMEDAALLTGDTLADAALGEATQGEAPPKQFCLCYLEGPALDSPALQAVFAALARSGMGALVPTAPYAASRFEAARITRSDNVRIVDPLDYSAMQQAIAQASFVITDCATLQRECYFHGTVALGLARSDFPEAQRSGWLRPVAIDEEAILAAALAPAPEQPPALDAHRGSGERAARFLTGL